MALACHVIALAWALLGLYALLQVEGKCRYSFSFTGQVRAYCNVIMPDDYVAISSLNPETAELVCNVPGRFNDSLANFSRLQHMQKLQFESPLRYTSYTMAGVDGAQSTFQRISLFENLTNLEDFRINIVLNTFDWNALRYLPRLRILDVSYTQLDNQKRFIGSLNQLLWAIGEFRPPLERLMMKGVQRNQRLYRAVPIKMGIVYRSLHNISLRILDLLENQVVNLEPGLSVHLPALEILRIGGSRYTGFTNGHLSQVCVFIDLLLHPSIREYTFHLPGLCRNSVRGKRGLAGYASGKTLKREIFEKIKHCSVNQSLDNFLCNIANCLCSDFLLFPCGRFHDMKLPDLFRRNPSCYAGIILPLPPSLQSFTMKNLLGKTNRVGPICFNPFNNVTYIDFSNGDLRGLVRDNFGLQGLKRLKYFNFQNNGIMLTHNMSVFTDMPSLEVLLLGQNPINLEFPEKMDFLQASRLRSLDMQGCSLRSMPRNILLRLLNLENLNVSGNSLKDFKLDISTLKHLRHLNLSNNQLKNLGDELRQKLDVLAESANVTLDLSLNPLECTCSDVTFTRWLKTTKVRLMRPDITTCVGPIQGKLLIRDIHLEQLHRICIHFDVIMSCIFSSLGVGLIIGVGSLIYKRRWRLRYWMHLANEALRRRQANETYQRMENDFVYDAFVAYSSHGEERSWVHTTLREKLEDEHGLKLCMYHLDFKVGRDLADTIVEGINSSSKILLILSPTFLNSCWCEFEVRMANEKIVRERRDAVILVLYSRLDQAGVRLPRKLARLLEKRIYIEWTEDPDGQKLFWDRLLQAMKEDKRHDAFGNLCQIPAPP